MQQRRVTLTLTEAQANFVANLIEDNYYSSDGPVPAFDKRIVTKVRKALERAQLS